MQRFIDYCLEKLTIYTGKKERSQMVLAAGLIVITLLAVWVLLPEPNAEELFDPESVDVELQGP